MQFTVGLSPRGAGPSFPLDSPNYPNQWGIRYSVSSAKDFKGLRSTVSQQFTRLAHRANRTSEMVNTMQANSEMTANSSSQSRPRLGRFSLRKRQTTSRQL
ncbi:unnamed protein product [Echinostoma caproni]|uniref:Movement protein n=1 Tax=Echinostoma caproni TaxID=27848 RepID=A0A183AXE0_9TREM|nr:unnamed protein product [Echinostoma caproni]